MKQPLIFLGADHAGFKLKEQIKTILLKKGYGVYDLSPTFTDGDDYPAHGFAVGRAVVDTPGARGVLICGSGVGVAIAANRIKGARAFEACDTQTVRLARRDDDVNVLTLSGWRQTPDAAWKLIELFLRTRHSGAARHRRRITQLG